MRKLLAIGLLLFSSCTTIRSVAEKATEPLIVSGVTYAVAVLATPIWAGVAASVTFLVIDLVDTEEQLEEIAQELDPETRASGLKNDLFTSLAAIFLLFLAWKYRDKIPRLTTKRS